MNRHVPDSCYCLQARQADALIQDYYDRMLEPAGVTARQYTLLRCIARLAVCSLRELADCAPLDRAALSRSLRPLLASGRVLDSRTGSVRGSRLCLSAEGRRTLTQAAALWDRAQVNVEEKLGREGLERLASVLGTLNAL